MPPQQLSSAERARARDAAGIIPGAAPVNALNGFVRRVNRALTPPNPRQGQLDADRARTVRRARLAQQLQNDAVRQGRARLSENEVNAHLRTMGVE